jgi:hypothetical protein
VAKIVLPNLPKASLVSQNVSQWLPVGCINPVSPANRHVAWGGFSGCQPNNVSGLTKKQAHAARGNERLNTARKARSARDNLGRTD